MLQYRYKITIEYLGTGFAGWQKQLNEITIQQLIEEAIYQFSREKVSVIGAGRTDAGVHALGQVAHFNLSKYYDTVRVMHAINHFLKQYPIAVVEALHVEQSFHARFSATKRHYLYRIINRNSKIIIDLDRAWWIKHPLNIRSMQDGAKYLIGKHDFTSFRSTACQAPSAIKTIDNIYIQANGSEIEIYVSAQSFLHHMVRNIVGTLVAVGINKLKPCDMKIILDAKDRTAAGMTAPACGLYFLHIDY